MKYIFTIFILFSSLFASELANTIKTDNNILNATLKDDIIYITTDGGEILIYNLEQNKLLKTINLPKIETYFGEHAPKIFSVDEFNGKIIFLSEGDYSSKVLHIYNENENIQNIKLDNEGIKKALFVDEYTIILASFSNELYFYDLKDKKIVDSYKISTSALSDMEVLINDELVVLGCESGKVHKFSLKDKKVIGAIDMHKDNIYDVAISKNQTIISGSADKFTGVFKENNKSHLKSNFLVYAVGISNDGKKGAFMSDENSKITIFDTDTLNIIDEIDTKQSIISGIFFYKDNFLISLAYEKDLKIWRY